MAANTRRVVGRIDEFPVGVLRIVEIDRREIGVIRLGDGAFRAILNRCPHRGAPICRGTIGGTWPPCSPGELRFALPGEVLVCPWHGWEFGLRTGEELFQSREVRLRMFPVSVADGVVAVEV